MNNKNLITESLGEIASVLNNNVKWLVASSGSLFIHGINIMPNDIDIVVDRKDYKKAKLLLKDYISSKTIDLGFTLKTPFEISGFPGELLTFDISKQDLEYIKMDTSIIPVNRLEVELDYYKKRNDKKDANRKKIKLIEKVLEMRNSVA